MDDIALNKTTQENLDNWLKLQIKSHAIPIYSSYDIRVSPHKVGNVDANIYPAGFNNIHDSDKVKIPDYFTSYLQQYPMNIKKILIVTEEHTENKFYWENIITLKKYLEIAGYTVKVAFAKPLASTFEVDSLSGDKIEVFCAMPNSEFMKQYSPDFIISNNDFSDPHELWAANMNIPMNPPRELGWYRRKKSIFFKHYNQVVNEFCNITKLNPINYNVTTEVFEDFDLASDESLEKLSIQVNNMITKLLSTYAAFKIEQEPTIFIKNNSGTYGLGVVSVKSGKEVLDWNYKSRKKMKAAKGGREVTEVIIQEGIPTNINLNNAVAEPVIYMVGANPVGSFFRAHTTRSHTESLNSPGASYIPREINQLIYKDISSKELNPVGWAAIFGLLAIGREAAEMNVNFKIENTILKNVV